MLKWILYIFFSNYNLYSMFKYSSNMSIRMFNKWLVLTSGNTIYMHIMPSSWNIIMYIKFNNINSYYCCLCTRLLFDRSI